MTMLLPYRQTGPAEAGTNELKCAKKWEIF